MAQVAQIASVDPPKLEKKPVKFSNLLCKMYRLFSADGADFWCSGRRVEYVRVSQQVPSVLDYVLVFGLQEFLGSQHSVR